MCAEATAECLRSLDARSTTSGNEVLVRSVPHWCTGHVQSRGQQRSAWWGHRQRRSHRQSSQHCRHTAHLLHRMYHALSTPDHIKGREQSKEPATIRDNVNTTASLHLKKPELREVTVRHGLFSMVFKVTESYARGRQHEFVMHVHNKME